MRKKADKERMAAEAQAEIEEERRQEKIEIQKFEKEKERRRVEWLNAARQAKKEAWAWTMKRDAEEHAREKAQVDARFQAAETERVQREAEKKAQEKKEARHIRELHKRKIEEEHRRKQEKMRQDAKALKEALKEALAAQYEADEKGKLTKKLDPAKKLAAEQKKLELERERAMRERDEEIAAKEAAYARKIKEEAFQRQLKVEEAQREVAATFKKNQEKELKDRLAREAADKARFAKIAKEMREKIDEDNRRKLQAEREAAQNLKEMKAAQYEADLAAHKRRERMMNLKAKQERSLQEMAWLDTMDWNARMLREETDKKAEAKRLFMEQRAMKAAEAEELNLARLRGEEAVTLALEERAAERALEEAAEMEAMLEVKTTQARNTAVQVKSLRTRALRTFENALGLGASRKADQAKTAQTVKVSL